MPISPTYLHKRCHSVIFSGQLAGPRGRGWAGRRLCRPPAGEGVGCAPIPGRWEEEGRWGAFSESAGVGADREDSIPIGRWAAQRAAKAGKGSR